MKLEVLSTYQVKVLSIIPRMKGSSIKSFNTAKGLRFLYDMEVEFKNKETMKVEFPSPTEDMQDFYVGVPQWMKVTNIKDFSGQPVIEVEPYDPESGRSTPQAQTGPVQTGFAGAKIQPSSSVGSSVTFAVAWAKDILVAELESKPEHLWAEVDEEDIKRMLKHADLIEGFIKGKIAGAEV